MNILYSTTFRLNYIMLNNIRPCSMNNKQEMSSICLSSSSFCAHIYTLRCPQMRMIDFQGIRIKASGCSDGWRHGNDVKTEERMRRLRVYKSHLGNGKFRAESLDSRALFRLPAQIVFLEYPDCIRIGFRKSGRQKNT